MYLSLTTMTKVMKQSKTYVNYESDHSAVQSSVNYAAETKCSVSKNCLGIVSVTVAEGNGTSYHAYALLDDEADETLCDERLLKMLAVPRRSVTYQMPTVIDST